MRRGKASLTVFLLLMTVFAVPTAPADIVGGGDLVRPSEAKDGDLIVVSFETKAWLVVYPEDSSSDVILSDGKDSWRLDPRGYTIVHLLSPGVSFNVTFEGPSRFLIAEQLHEIGQVGEEWTHSTDVDRPVAVVLLLHSLKGEDLSLTVSGDVSAELYDSRLEYVSQGADHQLDASQRYYVLVLGPNQQSGSAELTFTLSQADETADAVLVAGILALLVLSLLLVLVLRAKRRRVRRGVD